MPSRDGDGPKNLRQSAYQIPQCNSARHFDLNSAHNKVQHGLAVRARSDLRVTFNSTPPNADGTVPLSALSGDGTFDIFDRPILEFQGRAPKFMAPSRLILHGLVSRAARQPRMSYLARS